MVRRVVAGLAPTMKAAGYRKNGFRFRQEVSATVVRLVNVQSSQWNVGSDGEFTIDLGVYHRDLAALHDAMPVVESPLVQHCVVQERIGFLMPMRQDHWWSVDGDTDLEALGAEVASAWSKYGKPWLEKHSTLEGAQRFLSSRKFFFLAAMADLAMGRRREAQRNLAREIADAPDMKDRIDAWRRVHLTPRRESRRTRR